VPNKGRTASARVEPSVFLIAANAGLNGETEVTKVAQARTATASMHVRRIRRSRQGRIIDPVKVCYSAVAMRPPSRLILTTAKR